MPLHPRTNSEDSTGRRGREISSLSINEVELGDEVSI
jgi:hypothetical protein